jgi:arylsulfatase A-like enzyme
MHGSNSYACGWLSGLGLSLLGAAAPPLARGEGGGAPPKNVLFIAIDDLRAPQVGAARTRPMLTPNIDRLAAEGRMFHRHFVQAPTCGASRYALLTGQYPHRTLSWDNNAFQLFQQGHAPKSMPQCFREAGYFTAQTGKISHSPDGDPAQPEVPGAWDRFETPHGEWGSSWNAFFGYAGGKTRTVGRSPATDGPGVEVPDTGYPDGLLAEAAVKVLKELSEKDQPFFYAVGFYKPHLPFNAPKKYWDRYDRAAIDLSFVEPLKRRGGEVWHNYSHTEAQANDPDHQRLLLHGYYAAVSYVDAQVGKLLEAVDALGLRESTIVVLWSDHGFHLGELGIWGKHTLHDYSLQSPFILRVPGMAQPGTGTDAVVSSVDIYPTLVDLAGLPKPDHLDGTSFAALVADPAADPVGFALGFWDNRYTLRTGRHRLMGDRLFDHATDPGERTDVAAAHPEVVQQMKEQRDRLLAARKAAR